jgi:hypothetical protein
MLNRDMYYHDLTIKEGQTLNPNGFRIFVSGKLTLGRDARISRDGHNGNSSYQGAALTAGTLGGSGAGGYAGTQGEAVANSLGGSGSGYLWLSGGAATGPAPSAGGLTVFHSALQALSGRSLDGAVVNGGGGGSGSLCGSGGGVVVVAARTVVVSDGTATISADGGESFGGGGGAGGGVVVVITTTAQPAGLILSARGGSGNGCCGYGEAKAGADGFTAWLN